MKKGLKVLLVSFIVCFSVCSTVYAQPGSGPPSDPGDNPVPITGIEYLIAAGAAFGAKKLYDKKKK